jgi:molybdopterin-containing oxidoreductase family membrane subunit
MEVKRSVGHDFVWWVGIGHWNFNFCGIVLFRQRWRMAINRSAEAMTIFLYSSGFNSYMGRPWIAFLHTESIWFFVGEL